jgi:hypothetical protein
MMKAMSLRVGMALCLLVSAPLLTGCGSDAGAEDEASKGSLSLPLLTTAGDHTYRLDGALQIWGPQYQWLYFNEWDETASWSLTTGAYDAQLYSWALYRQDAAGSFQPVSADLIDGDYRRFEILNGTTTTISFKFETDGELVVVGNGGLNVEVEVTERAGLCTPLGDDCGEGAWCAPSELTGARLACVMAGAVEVGGECASPSDCVANASCFDLGDGARCAALCPTADFGEPCATGGTCSQRGEGYGVCAPDVIAP